MELSGLEPTDGSSLGPQDAAYWPLWVNITVPILSALAFAAVQALLLFVDDPGLIAAKRAGLYPPLPAASTAATPAPTGATAVGQVSVELGVLRSPRREANLPPSSSTVNYSHGGSDAAVQCDLLRPVASTPLLLPHHHLQPQQQLLLHNRQRTVSFGGPMDTAGVSGGMRQRSGSETMRMLEGMLLRPSRRYTAHHHHLHHPGFPPHLRHLSESEGRIGTGPIVEESLEPAAPATQSLTGAGGHLLMHSVHHYYQQQQQQRLQARQMRYSTPTQPDRRALNDFHLSVPPVPPTPPSSDRGDD